MLDNAIEWCDKMEIPDSFLNDIDKISEFIKTKISLFEERKLLTRDSRKFWNFFKSLSKYSKSKSTCYLIMVVF